MTLDAILPSSAMHSPPLTQQGTPSLLNGLRLGNEQPTHFPSPNHSAAAQPVKKYRLRRDYQSTIVLGPRPPPPPRNTSSYNFAALVGDLSSLQLDDDVQMRESSTCSASHNSSGMQSPIRQVLQSLIDAASIHAGRLNDEKMRSATNAVSDYVQLRYPATPPSPEDTAAADIARQKASQVFANALVYLLSSGNDTIEDCAERVVPALSISLQRVGTLMSIPSAAPNYALASSYIFERLNKP